MTEKKASGEAAWIDPDDAPELTAAFFDRQRCSTGTHSSGAAGAARKGKR